VFCKGEEERSHQSQNNFLKNVFENGADVAKSHIAILKIRISIMLSCR